MDGLRGYDHWKTTEPLDYDDEPEIEDDDCCVHGVSFDEECEECNDLEDEADGL